VFAAIGAASFLAGCFPKLAPTGAVLDAPFDVTVPAAPPATFPVPPFRLWGLWFEEEGLLELSGDPTYAMIEIAAVRDRAGEAHYFALLAERTGVQHVAVGNVADLTLAETFPAAAYDGRLRVSRLAGLRHVEWFARFEAPDGRDLRVAITARSEGPTPSKRNGNAMGHSEDRVLAVLDLMESSWAAARARVDRAPAPVRRLLGILPLAMRLEQTAGGLAAGGLRLLPAEGEARIDGVSLPVDWRGSDLVIRDRLVDLVYRFDGDRFVSGSVWHGEHEVIRFEVDPPLPDLRHPIVATSSFVIAANGQEGHAVGRVDVRPDGAGAVVDVLPDRPAWACVRPVRTTIREEQGAIVLLSERTASPVDCADR
jgi:hypothetical protein